MQLFRTLSMMLMLNAMRIYVDVDMWVVVVVEAMIYISLNLLKAITMTEAGAIEL